MQLEFAPMEGITGYVYRNTHKRHFNGVDRYFLPFLLPNQTRSFITREKRDIMPEHNAGMSVVPQVLTCKAEDFLWAVGELTARGYHEVNLNLGCPSGTVFTKGKGSGFLAHPAELQEFFEAVCPKLSEHSMKLSVKTRLGVEYPEEFERLLEIFNVYPLEELIIHTRVRQDFYKGNSRKEWIGYALAGSKNPVTYNGDIVHKNDIVHIKEENPSLESVMIGRGLLANPALGRQIKGGAALTSKEFSEFHWDLYESYQREIPGGKNILFKMKELWFYQFCMFEDRTYFEKRMRKVQKEADYEILVRDLFANLEVNPDGCFVPPELR